MSHPPRRVGTAIVGLGGAVATTAVAGLTVGDASLEEATGLVGYDDLVVGGWDLDGSDLYKAAEQHGVLDEIGRASCRERV